MLFLSIDFGTSAVKVEVLDEATSPISSVSATYALIRRPVEKVEVDPDALFQAVYDACAQLPAGLLAQVDAVCYDTFSPSPVFMKADGSLAYPVIVTHLDRRSRNESRRVQDTIGTDRYMEIAGVRPFTGGVGVLTAMWMQTHEPDVLAQTDHIGHLASYVGLRFTGEWAVDRVNASMLGVYETTTSEGWSAELVEAFGLEHRWFGRIAQPGSMLGPLRPEEARRLGVPAGIPVTVGTNDMAAAQVGAGNERPGQIMDTAGSSDMVSILVDRPVTDPHYYLRCAATPGLWQIYATTAGGFALDWFHQQFCREMERRHFDDEFLPRVLAENVDEGGVTFDPFLSGDRQGLQPRTATWHGLTLSATREQMLAALLVAMNRTLAETVQRAAAVVPLERTIKLTGGMATPAIIALKERVFGGFSFEVVQNCSVVGNVRLAQKYSTLHCTQGRGSAPESARTVSEQREAVRVADSDPPPPAPVGGPSIAVSSQSH